MTLQSVQRNEEGHLQGIFLLCRGTCARHSHRETMKPGSAAAEASSVGFHSRAIKEEPIADTARLLGQSPAATLHV